MRVRYSLTYSPVSTPGRIARPVFALVRLALALRRVSGSAAVSRAEYGSTPQPPCVERQCPSRLQISPALQLLLA
eukprot:5663799-Pleurochrysis_carterae.AAC.1